MQYVKNIEQLNKFLYGKNIDIKIINDIKNGIAKNSMSLKVSEHILSLINWDLPYTDPLRKQFLPLASEYLADHKYCKYDSLSEDLNKIDSRIIHRYPNKILFLASKSCNTYCAFCTRSYLIGPSTPINKKINNLTSIMQSISNLITYLETNRKIKDILISGGDIGTVHVSILDKILERLNGIDTINTIRLATRDFTFSPDSLDKNSEYFKVIKKYSYILKQNGKELSIQTHFNHANELPIKTLSILNDYFLEHIIIRNQTVLLKNINDNVDDMISLISKLISSKVVPYYIYQMDMVKNTEHFRTKIADAIILEKEILGLFPGFYTPKFIVDLPQGGGKIPITHYEKYEKKEKYYEYTSVVNNHSIHRYYEPN